MTTVCIYCGDPVGDRLSCCQENHFEEREDCPKCDSQDWDECKGTVTGIETFYNRCNECEHQWGHQ